MKQYIKVTLLMAVSLLVLTACQNNTPITGPAPQDGKLAYSIQAIGGKDVPLPFDPRDPEWVLRNIEAGFVQVSNDSQNLYVTYYLQDAWQLSQAQLHVGFSLTDIPVNDQGYPSPGEFSYQSEANLRKSVFTQQIPLSDLGLKTGDEIVLASRVLLSPHNPLSAGMARVSRVYDIKSTGTPEWWAFTYYRIRQNGGGSDPAGGIQAREAIDLNRFQ